MGSDRTSPRCLSPRTKPYERKEERKGEAKEESSSTNDPKILEPTELKIFCIVDGEATSFSVKILSNCSVDELKQAIKAAKKNAFKDFDADQFTLYKVSIPDKDKTVVESEIVSKEALVPASRKLRDIFISELPEETIHVFVKPPQRETSGQILKRKMDEDPQYISPSKKIRIEEGWREYRASDGKMVTLPPSWIAMLEDSRYLPKPRNEFEHLKDDLKAGSWVDIPSLGQVPKGYRVSEILVTHQMLELWNEMEEEQRCVYRRVLSGPMGIGKSFLSYFLTARAYAEGWLTLYISDAGTLDTSEKADSYMEVIERFLVMNKDVLTAAELETLVSGYGVQGGIWNTAIIRVFNMLMQKERKTLTIIDEHGKLFRFDKPVPEKFKSLKPLMDLSSWTEDLAGSRLILTGTAHAKFELEIMESSFKEDFKTVVFVGPLLDDAFKNLLKHTPNLQSTDYEDIRSITNLVPRELMNLSTYIEENPELPIKEAFEKFEDCRRLDFSHNIQNYYKSIEKSETTRTNFYNGLASAFLHGSVEGEFKWDFIDLGLLFRLRRDGVILFRPLCNTAFRALLDQFKTMGMPEDLKNRLKANRFSGNEFEQAIFHAFICTSIRPIVLPTTNLVGDPKGSIVLDFDDYRVISRQRHSLGPGKDKFLARGYPGYPRFDFMVGPIFIQVSVSEFGVHNRDSSDLRKAFKRPYKTPKVVYNDRNQIECYLDEMYGGKHRADFGKDGFIVTKKDPTTGIDEVVPGFRIVYICGRDINLGNHRQLVTELPDVEHVSFNDLKSLFFANIV